MTERLPGIHALRVLAAVAVFLTHILHITATQVQTATRFADHIGFGVPLFFAVSAFSLMYSTKIYAATRAWGGRFYLKRFFRIAPLYYFMLVVELTIYGSGEKPTIPLPDLHTLLLNVTFLFGLSPDTIHPPVLVGWSVGAEMLFYAVFPLILISVRGVWQATLLVVISIAGGELVRPWLDGIANYGVFGTLSDYHILTNFRYFACGVLAFAIFDTLRHVNFRAGSSAMFQVICLTLTVGLAAASVIYQPLLRSWYRMDMALWGAIFIVLCVWWALKPPRFLSWEPIQFLGERSYSLYLIHFPFVISAAAYTSWLFQTFQSFLGDWAIFPTVIGTYIPVIVMASVTYALIERPGMDLGKRITLLLPTGKPNEPIA